MLPGGRSSDVTRPRAQLGRVKWALCPQVPSLTAVLLPTAATTCDPVVEEHFRRSLGKNYLLLLEGILKRWGWLWFILGT